jgi:hypothetical protein
MKAIHWLRFRISWGRKASITASQLAKKDKQDQPANQPAKHAEKSRSPRTIAFFDLP